MTSKSYTLIVHDTDLHGLSCGVCALHALLARGLNADVYADFNPNGPGTCPPSSLPLLLEEVLAGGTWPDSLIVLDIPVDSKNPQHYMDSLRRISDAGIHVEWLDHHEGQDHFVKAMKAFNVRAIVVPSSYELTLLKPRELNVIDHFIEAWGLLGATADNDHTIADNVPRDLERAINELLDPVYKFRRIELFREIGLDANVIDIRRRGEVGALAYLIVAERIDPYRLLKAAKVLGSPLPRPCEVEVIGSVAYTLEEPPRGLAWKWAWALCFEFNAKAAVLHTWSPRTHEYHVIIAKYWRNPEVAPLVERLVMELFSDHLVTGHVGARSIHVGPKERALEVVPLIAEKLAKLLEVSLEG